MNYLNKKSKPDTEKSDEEIFALSIVPALKRMTDQRRALAKLRIQQVLTNNYTRILITCTVFPYSRQ